MAAAGPRLVAVVGGLGFALATPPWDVLPGVLVGLAALGVAIDAAPRTRDGFAWGWLWAMAANLVGLRFVAPVVARFTPLGLAGGLVAAALLAAGQALAWGVGAAVGTALRRRLGAPLEVALAAATLVAVSLPAVIPWSPAGLLSPWPALVQSAELVGERGTSALLAVAAGGLARAALSARRRTKVGRRHALVVSLFTAGGLALAAGLGALRQSQFGDGSDVARIALVQAAVTPEERWQPDRWPRILSALRRETALAENDGVDLVVWPEAAYPYPLRHDTRAMPRGQREVVGGAIDGPILLGFLASESPGHAEDGSPVQDSYNSATVVRPDRTMAPPHDKMELLWFGEAVPFGDALPWLRRTFQRSGGLLPGKALRRLDVERPGAATLRLGVLNCYEDTLPRHGRRVLVELAPDLLVNVTNDAWFTGTAAPRLHLRLSAMRAIELRRDLVRSVNLGPNAWFDAAGRLRAHREAGEPDFLVVTPTPRTGGPTLYARAGDWLTWGLLGLAVVASWRLSRRGPRDVAPSPGLPRSS